MPLVESEAIILRTSAFAEADKLVSFFSRRYGRLRGVAPAARKSRRRFGPALEPLTYVRLWFYERENRELTRLDQCEVLESFWEQAADYERSIALSHIAELCELLLPEREAHERNFRLTLMTLRCLREGASLPLSLSYFQLWNARLAGWLPSLDRCSLCSAGLDPDSPTYLSPSKGQLFCSRCRGAGSRGLAPATRQIALDMLSHPLPALLSRDWEPRKLAELQHVVLNLLEHHAERKLTTRDLLHAS